MPCKSKANEWALLFLYLKRLTTKLVRKREWLRLRTKTPYNRSEEENEGGEIV